MTLTKKFDCAMLCSTEIPIDEQINKWIMEQNAKNPLIFSIVDIKYNVTGEGYESALLIYRWVEGIE